MTELNNIQRGEEPQKVCPDESKIQKFRRVLGNIASSFSYLFTFRNYYYIEVIQALKKVESEYRTLRTSIDFEKNDNTTSKPYYKSEEIRKVEETIQELICKAGKEYNYSKLWPLVHQIELLLIKLYNGEMLIAYYGIVKNNLYVLNENDQKLWESRLEEYKDFISPSTVNNQHTSGTENTNDKQPNEEVNQPENTSAETRTKGIVKKNNRLELLRALLYTITAEINETRRIEYMANDLKRVLLKRVMWCTLLCGFFAWIFAYSLIRDTLVNYAVLLGLLGGFFSRLYSTKDLNFKPPAFALLAQYTYVQPLIGAIGAVIMYFILLSPLGTELINASLYMDAKQTEHYIIEKYTSTQKDMSLLDNILPPFKISTFITIKDSLVKSTPDQKQSDSAKTKPVVQKKNKYKIKTEALPLNDLVKVDTIKVVANQLITKYPKPLLLLILSFLAGFSEKFFLGTVNKIIGNKFIAGEPVEIKPEQKNGTTTQTTTTTQ